MLIKINGKLIYLQDFFANSTTKKSCILSSIYEIDNTDNFACDENAKKENWWVTDEYFK